MRNPQNLLVHDVYEESLLFILVISSAFLHFLYIHPFSFFFHPLSMENVCSLVVDIFFPFLSFLYSFLYFFLSFLSCSFFLSFFPETTGPIDLNHSGLFFLEIATKQTGNLLSDRFRKLLISQLDHKKEF